MTGVAAAAIVEYEQRTGECKTCGARIDSHPQCPLCGVICGPGHLDTLTEFRGHSICNWCACKWERLEAKGDRLTWEEALHAARNERRERVCSS